MVGLCSSIMWCPCKVVLEKCEEERTIEERNGWSDSWPCAFDEVARKAFSTQTCVSDRHVQIDLKIGKVYCIDFIVLSLEKLRLPYPTLVPWKLSIRDSSVFIKVLMS